MKVPFLIPKPMWDFFSPDIKHLIYSELLKVNEHQKENNYDIQFELINNYELSKFKEFNLTWTIFAQQRQLIQLRQDICEFNQLKDSIKHIKDILNDG